MISERRWRCVWGWLLAASLALGAFGYEAPAHAQGAKDQLARQLYKRGDLRYSTGHYEAAARDFERAYELSGRSALLYNLANVYEKLGRYDDALRSLRAYLPTAPDHRKVEVEARIVKLEPQVSDQRAAGPKPAPQPITVPVPVPVPVPTEPKETSEPLSTEAIAGWSLLGVGAAGVVLGGVMGGLALGARGDAETLCPVVDDSHRCPDTAQSALDDDSTFSLIADIGFVVGAAGIGSGVALLLLDAFSGDEDASDSDASPLDAKVSVAPSTNGGMLIVTGAF